MFKRWLASDSRLTLGFALIVAVFAKRDAVPFDTQHTYFIHGLALTRPEFARDWLASTADPQPVFSWLVAALDSLQLLHWFAGLQVCVTALFAYCLLMLVRGNGEKGRQVVLRQALVAVVLGWCLSANPKAIPVGGLADQYLVGSFVQPASFGVLLLLAIVVAGQGYGLVSCALACAAASVHPTYLLPALTVVGCSCWLARGQRHVAVRRAAFSALMLLPIGIYVLVSFGSTDAQSATDAAKILVQERLPHHARPVTFLPRVDALLGASVAVAGIWSAQNAAVRSMLLSLLFTSVAGVVLCLVFDLERAALLFPWRGSVVWVPAGCVLFLDWVIRKLLVPLNLERGPTLRARWALLSLLIALPLLSLVNARARSQSLDALGGTEMHGSALLAVVPPNLTEGARFTLRTPVYADWKSHPYAGREVLEWWRRVGQSEALALSPRCSTLRPLLEAGVTHLLTGSTWNPADLIPLLEPVESAPLVKLWRIADSKRALAQCDVSASGQPPNR